MEVPTLVLSVLGLITMFTLEVVPVIKNKIEYATTAMSYISAMTTSSGSRDQC